MFSIFDPNPNLSSSSGYNSSRYYILPSQFLALTTPTVVAIEMGSEKNREATLRLAKLSDNYKTKIEFMDGYIYIYLHIYMYISYVYIYTFLQKP